MSTTVLSYPPPPTLSFHVSGKSAQTHILQGIFCIACTLCAIWTLLWAMIIFLLHETNVPKVHESCTALWDFVLVSVCMPIIMPILLVLTVADGYWSVVSPSLFLFLSLLGITVSLHASMNSVCVETLRSLTPPFPWLLFVAWMKTVFFIAGGLSSTHKLFHHNMNDTSA